MGLLELDDGALPLLLKDMTQTKTRKHSNVAKAVRHFLVDAVPVEAAPNTVQKHTNSECVDPLMFCSAPMRVMQSCFVDERCISGSKLFVNECQINVSLSVNVEL